MMLETTALEDRTYTYACTHTHKHKCKCTHACTSAQMHNNQRALISKHAQCTTHERKCARTFASSVSVLFRFKRRHRVFVLRATGIVAQTSSMAEGEDTSFGQSQEILRAGEADGEADLQSQADWSDDPYHHDSTCHNDGMAMASRESSEAETVTESHAPLPPCDEYSDTGIKQEPPEESLEFHMSRKCKRKFNDMMEAEESAAGINESQERRRLSRKSKPSNYWEAKSDQASKLLELASEGLEMAAELEAAADAESQALKEQGQDKVRMPHFPRVGPDLTRKGLEIKSLETLRRQVQRHAEKKRLQEESEQASRPRTQRLGLNSRAKQTLKKPWRRLQEAESSERKGCSHETLCAQEEKYRCYKERQFQSRRCRSRSCLGTSRSRTCLLGCCR